MRLYEDIQNTEQVSDMEASFEEAEQEALKTRGQLDQNKIYQAYMNMSVNDLKNIIHAFKQGLGDGIGIDEKSKQEAIQFINQILQQKVNRKNQRLSQQRTGMLGYGRNRSWRNQ